MSLTEYSHRRGFVQTEQDLIIAIDDFLISGIGGWSRHYTISDTADDRDYVWVSAGETEEFDTIYIRLRGYSDYVYMYGYITFTDDETHTGEIHDSTYTRLPTSAYPFRYDLIGNKDFIQIHIHQADYYMGYAGIIRTYYLPTTDNLPLLIRGQNSTTHHWGADTQCYMHNCVNSGSLLFQGYNWDLTGDFLSYDVGFRVRKALLMPPVIYTNQTDYWEVRGEPFGVFQVSAKYVAHGNPLTTASGTFLTFWCGGKGNAFGPIPASGIVSYF